ncbi:unnamed protein product, partial [Chrysoparadoxa australica]
GGLHRAKPGCTVGAKLVAEVKPWKEQVQEKAKQRELYEAFVNAKEAEAALIDTRKQQALAEKACRAHNQSKHAQEVNMQVRRRKQAESEAAARASTEAFKRLKAKAASLKKARKEMTVGGANGGELQAQARSDKGSCPQAERYMRQPKPEGSQASVGVTA